MFMMGAQSSTCFFTYQTLFYFASYSLNLNLKICQYNANDLIYNIVIQINNTITLIQI